jgi:hypothetical protein
VAPPYDVIGPQEQRDLYEKHACNVIRLILNRDEPGDESTDAKYTRAANFLRRWISDGVMQQERTDALYVYHQEFEWEGRRYVRKGFLGRIRLEEFGKGKVFPHEETMSGPKADRLAPSVASALATLELALGDSAAFDPAASTRTFRIHMSDIGEGRFLPELMVALREQAPGVRLETLPLPRGEITDALDSGRIDFAFGASFTHARAEEARRAAARVTRKDVHRDGRCARDADCDCMEEASRPPFLRSMRATLPEHRARSSSCNATRQPTTSHRT